MSLEVLLDFSKDYPMHLLPKAITIYELARFEGKTDLESMKLAKVYLIYETDKYKA